MCLRGSVEISVLFIYVFFALSLTSIVRLVAIALHIDFLIELTALIEFIVAVLDIYVAIYKGFPIDP